MTFNYSYLSIYFTNVIYIIQKIVTKQKQKKERKWQITEF